MLSSRPLPPGSTIGILGGGQLGRMTALAAARLGYRCIVYAPDAEGSIAARFESQVVRIGPDGVMVEGPAGREELPADVVYLAPNERHALVALEPCRMSLVMVDVAGERT